MRNYWVMYYRVMSWMAMNAEAKSLTMVFSPELNKQLTAVLRKLNQARRANSDEAREAARKKLTDFARVAAITFESIDSDVDADQVLGKPSCSLAVYGSLRPGEQNFHVVEEIPGEWFAGSVEGELGSWRQYKRLVVDSGVRNQVPVDVLRSDELPRHWQRLDQFEGVAYERLLWPVSTAGGLIVASLYVRPVQD